MHLTFRILCCALVVMLSTTCHESGKRKFHLINLSLPKTGSTSIASIFRNYRSMHEGLHIETVTAILDWQEGKLPAQQLEAFLLQRDEVMEYPHVDSATFLHFVIDPLARLFPRAKFLLCVRDGEDWIVSLVSMLMQYFGPGGMMTKEGYLPPGIVPQGYIGEEKPEGIYIREFADRYGKIFSQNFSREAFRNPAGLPERIGPMLADFARFWGENTLRSLRQMPRERSLVLKTRELSQSVEKLAIFVGVPLETLRSQDSHKNRDPDFEKIRNLIGRDNIAKVVRPWQEKVNTALKAL